MNHTSPKTLLLLVCCALLATPAADAQGILPSGLRNSAGARLVESAVADAIVVVTHSYRLRDNTTGALYGLQGAPEFATGRGLGIKVRGGIILPGTVVRPWDYNSKFAKYKDDYTPVSYITQCTAPGQPDAGDSLTLDITRAVALVDSSAYRVPSPTFGENALAIHTGEEDLDGWVVWFTFEGDTASLAECKMQLYPFTQRVEAPKRGEGYAPTLPETGNTILGGMFVVPVTTSVGTLEFRLAGLVTRHEGEWILSCPFVGRSEASLNEIPDGSTQTDETPGTDGGDELTPIEGKQGKKSKTKK